jgi:hypothetical protein
MFDGPRGADGTWKAQHAWKAQHEAQNGQKETSTRRAFGFKVM